MRFKYEAVKRSGETLKGEIDAANEPDAFRLLQSQDLTPVRLSAVAAAGNSVLDRNISTGRVSTRDKAVIIRELATLLAAGVPLAEAVDSIAEAHAADPLGVAFRAIHNQLRGGTQLSVALRSTKLDLPDFVYQLVAAGELTGRLAPGLHSGANQMEYEETMRQEIRNALIYPAILVFAGIAAVLLVFIVVVPKFASLLRNAKANVPEISVIVLKAGLFVKTNLSWFGLGGAALVMSVIIAAANPRIRMQVFELAAKVPILGDWLLEAEIGRWAAMLGTLLENRVPIVRAMELAEGSVALSSLRQKLSLAVKDLRAGKKLADALAVHGTVSAMGQNLVRVGERSGELPTMLRTLAGLYETSSRARMKRFVILLEPITILLIGSAIGFIMVAIMLAITSLSNIAL
ncbi:MAG: type II secretion system F family protein [Burkholderiales bacterium]|nr:type II secretion system F family protein [Burkholderiales bacterium]